MRQKQELILKKEEKIKNVLKKNHHLESEKIFQLQMKLNYSDIKLQKIDKEK